MWYLHAPSVSLVVFYIARPRVYVALARSWPAALISNFPRLNVLGVLLSQPKNVTHKYTGVAYHIYNCSARTTIDRKSSPAHITHVRITYLLLRKYTPGRQFAHGLLHHLLSLNRYSLHAKVVRPRACYDFWPAEWLDDADPSSLDGDRKPLVVVPSVRQGHKLRKFPRNPPKTSLLKHKLHRLLQGQQLKSADYTLDCVAWPQKNEAGGLERSTNGTEKHEQGLQYSTRNHLRNSCCGPGYLLFEEGCVLH